VVVRFDRLGMLADQPLRREPARLAQDLARRRAHGSGQVADDRRDANLGQAFGQSAERAAQIPSADQLRAGRIGAGKRRDGADGPVDPARSRPSHAFDLLLWRFVMF
jgi:hypothetical protein